MLGCRHPVMTTLVTRSALAHASERHRKTTHGTSALARERRRKVASVLAYHRHDTSALARERYPIIRRYPTTPLRWQVINHIGRCPPTVKPSHYKGCYNVLYRIPSRDCDGLKQENMNGYRSTLPSVLPKRKLS